MPNDQIKDGLSGDLKGLVDLHCHSTASDGSYSPSLLAEAAVEAGLSTLALTDHDTVEGVNEFMAACDRVGLEGLGGVELSLEHTGTMHLLGLNVGKLPTVPAPLEELQFFRQDRNQHIFNRLNQMGYHISWEEVLSESGGGVVGRPHFASLLVRKGYFENLEETFSQLLRRGSPAYIHKKRLNPEAGIKAVIEVGWIPVLAHPITLGLAYHQWPPFLRTLTEAGLVGLETHHPRHNPKTTDFFAKLALDFDLIPTAGSDFHGANKPEISLDWVKTNSPFFGETIELLRSRQGRITAPSPVDLEQKPTKTDKDESI